MNSDQRRKENNIKNRKKPQFYPESGLFLSMFRRNFFLTVVVSFYFACLTIWNYLFILIWIFFPTIFIQIVANTKSDTLSIARDRFYIFIYSPVSTIMKLVLNFFHLKYIENVHILKCSRVWKNSATVNCKLIICKISAFKTKSNVCIMFTK